MKDLIDAIKEGNLPVVEELIKSVDNVNFANKDGKTPLYWAAIKGHTDVARLLIQQGADVNLGSNCGLTPLYWAAINGNTDLASLLIEQGADVNLGGSCGLTPLYWAAIKSHTDIARLLIKQGAEIYRADKYGKTPLYWAVCNGHTDRARLLIEWGAEINLPDDDGQTLLHLAASKGHTDLARLLIEQGSDVNLANKYYETPLNLAISKGHPDLARLLIEQEADVNRADKDGETPLHLAAYNGHTDLARLLVEQGADVNQENKYGETPLYSAAYDGHTELASLLIDKGAELTSEIIKDSKIQNISDLKDRIDNINLQTKETIENMFATCDESYDWLGEKIEGLLNQIEEMPFDCPKFKAIKINQSLIYIIRGLVNNNNIEYAMHLFSAMSDSGQIFDLLYEKAFEFGNYFYGQTGGENNRQAMLIAALVVLAKDPEIERTKHIENNILSLLANPDTNKGLTLGELENETSELISDGELYSLLQDFIRSYKDEGIQMLPDEFPDSLQKAVLDLVREFSDKLKNHMNKAPVNETGIISKLGIFSQNTPISSEDNTVEEQNQQHNSI